MQSLPKIVTRTYTCNYCTKPHRNNVSRSIYFSKHTDIFTNLALEDWLYKNRDFTNHHILMLWRNEPCVVIGRHQNPWLECNFAALPSMGQGVKLARRNSGGGTVYHDMENLNLTFFTSREDYSRKRNLELISRALQNGFKIHSEINQREDLCIDDCKISGTASKLGRNSAYHHCTLLVNANKQNLSMALKNIVGPNVETNASVSVRSKTMNLSEKHSIITVDDVMEAIIMEFNANLGIGVKIIDSIDEANFPGVTETKKMFLSTEWRFEKTPKFTINRDIFVDDTNIVSAFLVVEKSQIFNIGIRSRDVNLNIKDNNFNLRDLRAVFNKFMDKPFSKEVLDEFEMVVSALRNSEKCRTMVLNR